MAGVVRLVVVEGAAVPPPTDHQTERPGKTQCPHLGASEALPKWPLVVRVAWVLIIQMAPAKSVKSMVEEVEDPRVTRPAMLMVEAA